MTTLRDIALARAQTLDTKEDKPPRYRAVIVEQRDSSGKDGVYVEGRKFPFYLWVRMWNSDGSVLPAFNGANVPAIAGWPVYITRSRGSDQELEIIGVDKEILAVTDLPVGFSNVGQHGWAHEMPDGAPGFDPVLVYPRAWSQLRTYATDPLSLIVNVSPLVYPYGNTRIKFDGGTVDLTAVEAGLAAGQARLVLIYLDLTTNTLGSANGAIGADAGGWFLDEPVVSNDTIPSAVVRIAEAQTEISEAASIRDRRWFLNSLPGDAGNWPYSVILSVATDDPDADYDNIADAIAAAAATRVIVMSPETFTCDAQTLPNDADLIGWDKQRSILGTVAQNTTLTIGSDTYLRDVQITITRTVAAAIQAIKIDNDNCELEHIIAYAYQIGAGDAHGIHVDGAADNLLLVDVRAEGNATGGGDDYGLYIAAGGSVQGVYGGHYTGGEADIFVGAGSEVYLFGPVLANGTIAGTGDWYGWYWDEAGDFYTVNSDIIVEDDDATALIIRDAGGLEYVRFVSTDAQPAVVFNEGGVDIDFRIESATNVNAFVVEGASGRVAFGIWPPGGGVTSAIGFNVYDGVGDSPNFRAIGQSNDYVEWRFDDTARSLVVVLKDNKAEAMRIVDDGALVTDYFTIVSANAQREVVINQDGADIDFRVEAVGEANAFFVRGSDGYVGIGTPTPLRDIHLLKTNAGGQVRLQVENADNTDPASLGVISIYTGGANAGDPFLHWQVAGGRAWSMGIDNSDDDKLKISEVFGLGTPRMTIAPGGDIGYGTTMPGSIAEWNMATENLELVDAGSAAATEQGWVEVQHGNVQGYIRIYAAK